MLGRVGCFRNFVTPFIDNGVYVPITDGLIAAYSSQRRVVQTYTDSLINAVNAGTLLDADIGYDANNDLDTSEIDTLLADGYDGLYAKIYDQSGNANDFTQPSNPKQPDMVSYEPYMDGTQLLKTTNGINDEYITVIAYMKADNVASNRYNPMDTDSTYPYNGLMAHNFATGVNLYFGDGSGIGRYLIQATLTNPANAIMSYGFNGAKNNNFISVNGVRQENMTPIQYGSARPYFNTNQKFSWGYYSASYGSKYIGREYELYIYDRMLSAAEVAEVELFINNKYVIY